MASLSTGSVNFPNQIYENPPQLVDALAESMLVNNVKPEIEVFDAAMLYSAKALLDRGLLRAPAHVQFVMGVPNAIPSRRKLLEFLIFELREMMPGATWTGAGIGRHQLEMNHWCLELGGHTRTSLEDNLRYDKTRLAISNAELVARVVEIAGRYGRRPATPSEARRILSLAPAS
jgi:uncharacterized protein (DUF849 family)